MLVKFSVHRENNTQKCSWEKGATAILVSLAQAVLLCACLLWC